MRCIFLGPCAGRRFRFARSQTTPRILPRRRIGACFSHGTAYWSRRPPVPRLPPQDIETARWFDQEVRPHATALRAWLRARFPSLLDPDDLVQESYLRLLRTRAAGGSVVN